MFSNAVAILSVGLFAALQVAQGADVTREVAIPNNSTDVDAFCTTWNNKCIALAHRAGKAYDRCGAGYDGAGTARVDCLAVVDSTSEDFTERVAAALNATLLD
ncbi:hypothetical protein PLICRDRAFT_41020 [Plicaturopsis crispa FD-325 SS-3]|nr:hypothetical protein PLICRDRAFT_41020 [Plicaturopsis crispa FD-325 SS-3]